MFLCLVGGTFESSDFVAGLVQKLSKSVVVQGVRNLRETELVSAFLQEQKFNATTSAFLNSVSTLLHDIPLVTLTGNIYAENFKRGYISVIDEAFFAHTRYRGFQQASLYFPSKYRLGRGLDSGDDHFNMSRVFLLFVALFE